MAEFSASTIADLPRTTADSLRHGDPRVLGFLKEWREEGDAINQSDPSYACIEQAQRYIVGEQLSPEHRKLKYLPQVVDNETRKAMQAHVSALTDLQPLFGWRSTNPAYALQSDILNRVAIAEWVETRADTDLADTIKYSLAGGTGDLLIDWDPHAPGGGAHTLTPRDPRDTLPLRPSLARSIQLWEGVMFREEHTVNVLKGKYPTQAHLFRTASDSMLSRVMGRFRSGLTQLLTPSDPLAALSGGAAGATRAPRSGRLVFYRCYLKDRTRNLTGSPIPMGEPGTAWAYVAAPGAPLYPRGRLILATDDAIVYDGPNTYWHGQFPFARLKLWSVPWQFLGVPLFNDLLPIQDAINGTLHDIRLGIKQWVNPSITYNRNAISEASMRLFDSRKPGERLKVAPGFGDPVKREDGPNPQVLALAIDFYQALIQKFADLSGTANLTALLQLRQMPAADTIEKYFEALTPEIRSEARQIELFLCDVSEQIKVNYFQFLSKAKRVNLLGDVAVTLADFDYDPDILVPALRPGDPQYTPELDALETTRDQRAQFMHKQFVFMVAPNSILAIDGQERKMRATQEVRAGLLDFWSYHEVNGTPNVGAPPAIPLTPLEPPPATGPDGITPFPLFMLGQGLQSMQMGGPIPQYTDPVTGRTFVLDPASGQIQELRVPNTITERLQAQQLLGIGLTVSPQGRKASGQAPPKTETKHDEPGGRQTTTESRK